MKHLAASRGSGHEHVVIAGGGFAAVETLLALRAIGAARAKVTLIAPDPTFRYRPSATASAFADPHVEGYDLRAIASDLGATFHRARLAAVGSQRRYVRLSSGARLGYDDLVLAVGARAIASIPGALTFRDQRDVPLFRGVLQKLRDGVVRRLVFALPSGYTWPLPLYELALFSASYATTNGLDVDVTVVSPEHAPLAVFGENTSGLIAEMLAARGVAFRGTSIVRHARSDGSIVLESGDVVPADKVVAMPRLRGQNITGVPSTRAGFIPTDGDGRVLRTRHVYAAGDITTFPVKQAGISTQQADRIAQVILEGPSGARTPTHSARVLQARMLGGENPLFLRTELDDRGLPASRGITRAGADVSPDGKVFARYLTPYVQLLHGVERDGLVAQAR